MELSQIALNQGLTFLVWATGIILLVVGGFLVKLLIDLSTLTKNLNQTSVIVNTELKPTLKELNQTLSSINEIVKNTDKGVGDFKSAVGKLLDKTKIISGTLFGGLFKGFTTAYKLFKK
jgi:predicted PurR-regulated permease PerM